MIEFKNLTKYYHSYRAVEYINCTLQSNRVAVYGEESSGKSTILRLLAGVEQASSGEVLINGNKCEINKNTYFTFRDGGLLKNKTIKQNLAYPLTIRGEQNIENRVNSLISEFDLERAENLKPNKLTFDERARVILAKITSRNTDILLVDNPFSNLDSKLRNEYFNWFLSIINNYKGLVVYATDDKSELDAFNEVILLNYGFVKGTGKLCDITCNPSNIFAYSFDSELKLFNGKLLNTTQGIMFDSDKQSLKINEDLAVRIVPEFMPTECILAVKTSELLANNINVESVTLKDISNIKYWLFDWNENSLIK